MDNVVLYHDYAKWYSDFYDVGFIEEFLEYAGENNLAFSFFRIGEGYDDIEEIECNSEELVTKIEIRRSI